MMVEACHFPFFPTQQNLKCEQLGESEAGPEKISRFIPLLRHVFVAQIDLVSGGGGGGGG